MVCQKCNSLVEEDAVFCSVCGEKILGQESKNQIKYCIGCGEVIKEGSSFCARCGTPINTNSYIEANNTSNTKIEETSSRKITGSYYVSVINAIVCFFIRLAVQEEYYVSRSLLRARHIMGIRDVDTKSLLTFIPVVAAVIVCLMIATDKKVSSQKKITALLINAIFIALALLFIWFNIPWD